MTRLTFRTALIAVFLMGLALASNAQAQTPTEIKIGATLPITGRFSTEWGPGVRDFMLTWQKLVNKDGGIFLKKYNKKLPVNLVLYDDESSPEKSVELYERLASVDKVDLFLGPGSSPITLRASTVAEQLKIPMLAIEADSPLIFARGFQWIVGVLKPVGFWSESYFDMIKELRKKGEKLETIAFVVQQDPHSSDVGKGAMVRAKDAGLTIVDTEEVPLQVQDFSAIISKVKAAKPDIVYSALFAFAQTGFLKQAASLGLKVKDMHVIHMVPELVQSAGANLAEGLSGDSEMARRHIEPFFWEVLKELKVTDPYDFKSDVTPVRYLAMDVMKRALEDAGTLDRATVMASLKAIKFNTLAGPFHFNFNMKVGDLTTNGIGSKPYYTTQIQGGKIKGVWPPDSADAPFKPTPWPKGD